MLRLIGALLQAKQNYLSECKEKRSADFAPHHPKCRKTLIF
jgi:hypothetical protein